MEPPAEHGVEADPGEGLTATHGARPAALRLDDCHAALLKIVWDVPTCAAPLGHMTWTRRCRRVRPWAGCTFLVASAHQTLSSFGNVAVWLAQAAEDGFLQQGC